MYVTGCDLETSFVVDNINTWTGLPVEESIRMTKDRDKWTEINGESESTSMVWPSLGSRTAKDHNSFTDSEDMIGGQNLKKTSHVTLTTPIGEYFVTPRRALSFVIF